MVRVRVIPENHPKLVKELPHLHYLFDQVKESWIPYLLDALMPYLSSNLDPWFLDPTSTCILQLLDLCAVSASIVAPRLS